jgi:hypothetical protein
MFAFRPRINGIPLPQSLLAAALLFDFLLAATLYNAFIPVFEQPDEHGHYFFAQHLAQTGELPVQVEDVDARGPWEQEGSQPPLYYFLAAPLINLAGADLAEDGLRYNHQNSMGRPEIIGNENRFIHDPDQEAWPWHGYTLAVHLGRGLSTLMAALTLYCIWLLARRIFPGRRWLSLACLALVGFNPQFLALSAAFSNDNAIILLSAASLLLVSRIADNRDLGRTVPLLAITAGLAPLAKLSGLALLGFVLLSLGWLAWRKRDPAWLLMTAGPVLLSAALLSGWWYARNIQLYDSLTGLNFMLPERMGRSWRLDRWLRTEAWGELRGIWWSTWGIFGWFTILLPRWIYRLISLLAGLALIGLGMGWRYWRRAPRVGDGPETELTPEDLEWKDEEIWWDWLDWPRMYWLLAWAGLVGLSLLRWLTISKGGQGRLMFPALATLAVVLVAGWRVIFAPLLERLGRRLIPPPDDDPEDRESLAIWRAERGDAALFACIVSLMYAFAAWTLLFVIRPAYAWPQLIPESAISTSATRTDIVFGEGLRLAAVDYPERVVEDESLPVTLYWQVEGEIERDGFVALDLGYKVDDGDQVTGTGTDSVLAYPGAGAAPPDLLSPSDGVYVDYRRIAPLKDATSAGLDEPVGATIDLGIYDPSTAESWPIAGSEDHYEESFKLVVDPRRPRFPKIPAGPPLVRFENGLEAWLQPIDLPAGAPEQFAELHRLGVVPFVSQLSGFGTETDLLWKATRDGGENLQVFVHLLDADGKFLHAFDHALQTKARYSVGSWRAGEVLPSSLHWDAGVALLDSDEARAAKLSESWPGTRYGLRFGLYRLADGSRIPAFDADGERYPDDAIFLHEIEIVEVRP